MADRIPLILNTNANQIQEMPSGDTLDLTGSNIKGVGILTVTTIDCNGDLDVDGHINFDNVSVAGVTTFTGNIDANGDLDVDGHTNLDNISVAGITTFAGEIDANGKIVGAQLQNVIPFYYDNTSQFPSASTYHGAVAHAHNTGRLYFAHAGWKELVNVEQNGIVGTGTQRYNIGALVSTSTTATSLKVTGVSTLSALTATTGGFSGALTGTTAAFSGNVSVGGVLTYEDVSNVDSVGIVTARSGVVTPNVDVDDFISVGSNIHLGNAGIITASSYRGDGSQLTGIVAGLSTVSGVVNVANDLDVDGHTNLDNLSVAGVATITGNVKTEGYFSSNDTFYFLGAGGNAYSAITTNSHDILIDARGNSNKIMFRTASGGNNPSGTNGWDINSTGHLVPSSDSSRDIGTNSVRVRNIYSDTLYGDGSNLTGISAGVPGISTTGLSGFNHVNVGGAITCTGTIVNKIDATTENSVIIGFEANLNNTNTDSCVIIGNRAGYQNATGQSNNTFIGRYAGYAGGGTNGNNNTMVGSGAGMFMYGSGSYNAALGQEAGYFNNKTYCVSIGANSGHSRGEFNVAIGGYANGPGNTMNSNYMTYPNNNSSTQWGDNNIIIGYQANPPNSDADNYIVIGNSKHTNFVVGTLGVEVTAGVTTHSGSVVVGAGVSVVGIVTAANFLKADGSAVGGVTSDAQANTVGGTNAGDSFNGTNATFNTLFGRDAGTAITTGDGNTAFGSFALASAQQTDSNVALGYRAMYSTTGSGNVAIGQDAMKDATSRTRGVCIGYQAGMDGGTEESVLIGYQAGDNLSNGDENVAVGDSALGNGTSNSKCVAIGYLSQGVATASNNTGLGYETLYQASGAYNLAVGYQAGKLVTTATKNTYLGAAAGMMTSSGSNNTAVGYEAGKALTQGENNVIAGYQAGLKVTSGVSLNVIIGKDAWKNNTGGGYQNVALGFNALGSGVPSISGNVALGGSAGQNVTDNYNTFIGHQAGDALEHGGNNIIIGYDADASTTSTDNEITLGNSSITKFRIPGCGGFNIDTNGHVLPGSNNASDLGSTSYRWANLYTNDLNLSNEGSVNKVDGTWGNYTIQEGESDLFLINNRSGKKYKFNLTEVS